MGLRTSGGPQNKKRSFKDLIYIYIYILYSNLLPSNTLVGLSRLALPSALLLPEQMRPFVGLVEKPFARSSSKEGRIRVPFFCGLF